MHKQWKWNWSTEKEIFDRHIGGEYHIVYKKAQIGIKERYATFYSVKKLYENF